MRMIFRQDQKRPRYSSSTSFPPPLIDFIPALAPGEEGVSDFQGGAGGGDAELRPEMQLLRIQTTAEFQELSYKYPFNCLKDSKDIPKI